jgi:hypothetical protein
MVSGVAMKQLAHYRDATTRSIMRHGWKYEL